MPTNSSEANEGQIEAFIMGLADLDPEGDTLPPTFVCQNKNHTPRHVAVGLQQKKDFNSQYKCKKWKPAKLA
jgi:hypothetical protein